VFHGLGPSTGVDVLSIHSRLIEVEKWTEVGQLGVNEVYIGKGVAEQWGLRLNDRFKVVVPVPDDKSGGFSRHVSELQVKGILDLGRYDWNQRTLMGNLETAQLMSQIDSRQFFGLTLRLQEGRLAKEVSESLTERFKTYFDFQSWSDLNENLLRAVAFDRAVVFLVVMLIVVVAAFNISSSLIVSVMSRYSDISLLRTIGFDQGSIQRIFVWQGFFVAVVGTLVGLVVGMGLGLIFEVLQTKLNLLNGSVYRLDGIKVAWQMKDFFLVVISTLVVCVLASWFPARRGSKLSIVEGLRYG
jgi:lipoprotein-releasing system permease protein